MKLVNSMDSALDEMLQGILATQPGEFFRIENAYGYALARKKRRKNKVQVIVDGGAGWGPLFAGFVGEGLADAMVHGDFNCAPNAWLIYETAKCIHEGQGVFILANHYAGDFLNNDMAQELLAYENIDSYVCYASDNVCSARGEEKEKRGGMSGVGILTKIAAAMAKEGASLHEITEMVERANQRLRTVAVCCNEKELAIEYGNGFSGEPPTDKEPFVSADRTAEKILDMLLKELMFCKKDSKFHIMVNRMKSMSWLEGYVMTNALKQVMERRGFVVGSCAVGAYFDVFETNGCIVSLLAYDEEMEKYLYQAKGYDFTI